ncbi:MAG: hypothetical protein QG625_4187 [Cyanobacteriota bacterium erpe_2018_sw_39hr_WHONDRS-SW48-000098_B_bin.30]|nr:PAS domain-containing protein [Candidatus Obscuribacter sp.]MDQ5968030.1 hypothetical protein [Cyanobacteriota bacterium erpe_2018_sw_39hr_WHONDRS-SW48-000098_B_bin.30]
MNIDRDLGGAADYLSEIVWSIEPDGVVSFTNRSWRDFAGPDRESASVHLFPQEFPSPDILHSHDRERLTALWQLHKTTLTPFEADVRFYKVTDKSYAWYMLSMSPILAADKTLSYWQAIITNIDQLKSVQAMFQLVMDNIPISIFWKDRKSIYLGCNRMFLGDVGLAQPEELIGKSDYDNPSTKEQSDFFVSCDRRVMESGSPEYHIIEPQLRADGRKAWLDTSKVPLRDAGGEVIGVLGMYEDITKRISLENQREEFVAALTHDLKNPIIGANRLLDVLIAAGDADIGIPKQELLEKVKGSNHSLLLLIQNMLEVYRYECGDSERRSEHFCMSRIIRLCVEDIREEANTKNIELSFQSDGADMEVTGNKQEIIRVLQNLLENAVKFTPPKGHVEVTLSESEEQCRIEVKDDGIGINSDEQKHLFSRFWQGTKGKNICNSSGLGLYICKKIVESHGGAISAQSTPSRGATFRVTLPGRKVKSPCEC